MVSHNHYDHMDIPTLRRLTERDRPLVVTGLGNRAFLEQMGILPAEELDWWEGFDVAPGIRLTAVPARHRANRSIHDENHTLWAGYVVEGPSGVMYFAGDTGYGIHYRQIHERFGPVRLALLPIGAFQPRPWITPVHMGPQEALKAHDDLAAGTSVAIHFGTFPLAFDGETEAVDLMRELLAEEKPCPPNVWILDFGEGRDVPQPTPARTASPEIACPHPAAPLHPPGTH
jgi:L-ascorbate metabolism protein UlaG (beta-lactamase superfamily)